MNSNCYKCKYRGNLSGSTHSRCNVIKSTNNEKSEELEFLIATGAFTLINSITKEELVKLDSHGVRSGWAQWPINFDPIWVESCVFYNEG
jgi:hypothetical protein